jgi:hypothetical protein
MTAQKLLDELVSAGYVLRYAAGKINVKGPGERLPDDVRAQILAVRGELVELLEAKLQAQLDEAITVVSSDQLAADLVEAGQLHRPDAANPWARLRRRPIAAERRIDPLPLAQLRLMPIPGVVARLCLTADRLGRLIDLGRGDSEEAQELAAERQWIALHRPEAWRAPVRPPPP